MSFSISSVRAAASKIPDTTKTLLTTIAWAAAAGGSAVAFLTLTNLVFHVGIERLAGLGTLPFILGSLAVVSVTSIASGLLMHFVAPDAAGSGVPQLKAAYWKEFGYVRLRSVAVKFVAGILTLGGGTSLGREGPSVFVGGGIASNLAAALGTPKTRRRPPAATGAAAALAAAFNTPLASITFVLEEMLNNEFGSRVVGSVVLAGVLGALITHAILGPQPAFSLPSVEGITWRMYVVVPVVAALSALVGVVFHKTTISLRARVRDGSRWPGWLRPLAGALATWALGCGVYLLTGHIGVFGLGYGDLSLALNDRLVWETAGILVAAKLVATVIAYATGGSGGIFSPTLFFGGLAGLFVAGAAGTFIPLTEADRIVLAAVGMSACFNAVVRAPLTAVLIVFEMTHQFAMVPALMIGLIVSQAVARLAGRHTFYEALLLQDGHELIRIKPPRDLESWQRLPVSEIARTTPVILADTGPDTMRRALEAYPYQRFPVGSAMAVKGIVSRREMGSALTEKRPPALLPARFCPPGMSVREVGQLLIESPSGLLLVQNEGDGRIRALVTLHDLLRAEAALSD